VKTIATKARGSKLSHAASVLHDGRWKALCERSADRDGDFVYAVCTTGVYCRPSCGARTPRPENVSFYRRPADAERAGYRACKRCKPEQATLRDRKVARVAELCRWIETCAEPPSLTSLAAHAELSPHHLHRMFKEVTGLTPKAYADAKRKERLQAALHDSGTVTEALYGAGFASSGRFYAASNQALGMTPTRYRNGGLDVEIRFAISECSLGAVLVAATERGVCAILLGDDPNELAHDLERRFPRASLFGGDRAFEERVATVVDLIDEPRRAHSLPLDVLGSAFQHRVWRALRDIPAGQTVSYTELARRIGAPTSARAVAGACAKNPLAVVIPCHRVVRTDGDVSGYRWGVERKRALLQKEGSAAIPRVARMRKDA